MRRINEVLCKIYKITNQVNGYVYVGSTVRTLEERFQEHARPSLWRKLPDSNFYQDMKKYSPENFKIELLDICFERHRFILEEYWWNELYKKEYLMYDIKRGSSHSDNTKQRLALIRNSENRIDYYHSDEFKTKISEKTSGELNGMWGKKDEEAINGRIVSAFYDENHTQLFKNFNSVKTALNFLHIKGHSGLYKACRTNELYHGYYWIKEWIDR